MENVVLTIHLILALLLIGVVLLQRSEGGGLGMGGGGGGGGVMTGRQAANALSKLTWIFAIGFIMTSVSLTVLAARNASTASVVDAGLPETAAPAVPLLPELTLPALPSDAPATPPPAN
jgi:preprotein translocase subunit SecG